VLDEMREKMDPTADKVAAELIEQQDLRGAVRLLSFFARNDMSVDIKFGGVEMTPLMKAYFEDQSHFQFSPEEEAMLDRASDIFELHGPMITSTLGVRSLLKQYAHTKATNVLRMTTLLEEHTDRRITETFQFVLDVMQKGWYRPEKRGIRSIQKLRLVHALIRVRILHGMTAEKEGKWDPEWGQPINQEDMAFAIQTFSVEIIQGLRQVGVPLSDEQAEDYLQAWKLIGRALGVDRSLEPANYDEAAALQQQIYARNFTLPDPSGPPLATALIKFFLDISPFEISETTIITIIKYFNGEENYHILRDSLKIDTANSKDDLIDHLHKDVKIFEGNKLVKGLVELTDKDLASGKYGEPLRLRILEFFMNEMMRAIFRHKRGSKSTSFQIDDALANKWGLPGNEGIPTPEAPPIDGQKKKHFILELLEKLMELLKALFGKKD